MTGAERICQVLEALGSDTVFSLPGGQNIALFDALRSSRLRTVVATSELGAAFMANGCARASGRPGILTTIPGPGFTYALTGVAEAFLDSTPVLFLLGAAASAPGARFQLQALPQSAIVAPMARAVRNVGAPDELASAVRDAFAATLAGEPGPVVVQIPAAILEAEIGASDGPGPTGSPPATTDLGPLERRLSASRRPLFYVGQGTLGAAPELGRLTRALPAPLVTTTSARGVVPEDAAEVLCFDRRSTEILNALVEASDLVIALGCKFSHNGAHGFRLRLPPEKLVHVDASRDVLGANYPASLAIVADAAAVVRHLQSLTGISTAWSPQELGAWRTRARSAPLQSEPVLPDFDPPSPAHFFSLLRRAMPRESCLVLDSGLHQMLARRHFEVLCPRGLILPTDLQSMGFAIPAAIGAALAVPGRPVVALLGDGGLAMSGLELLTAVRERVALTVIVFNDGRYGLIRRQQIGAHGREHGTSFSNPDFGGLARALGVSHARLATESLPELELAIRGDGVRLLEVRLSDAPEPSSLERWRRGAASRIRRLASVRRG